MKKYIHLIWLLILILGSGTFIFDNLLSEIKYFGLFTPNVGVLTGVYPVWFYIASVLSIILFCGGVFVIFKLYWSDLKKLNK